MGQTDAMDGMLRRLGHQLTHYKDKELSSTLTTTNRFMRFLDTSPIYESTKRSSFDPADLLKGKMTVYLIIPPDRMRAQSPLLRLWVGSMLRAVVKGGLQSGRRVHFVLDEAASLGHMDVLDDAVDKLRGYGVRLLFLYQSLGQLRRCFPEGQDQTLLSNVTQVYFGVNDQQTAEYVSARLGETTIITESGGVNRSVSRQHDAMDKGPTHSRGSNQNWQYMGRKLLKAEEVVALPERMAITFTPGVPPLATRLVRYYEKDFKQLNGIGPVRMAMCLAWLFLRILFIAVVVTALALNQGIQ
jgi:type IV secretion system protein VirD4